VIKTGEIRLTGFGQFFPRLIDKDARRMAENRLQIGLHLPGCFFLREEIPPGFFPA